MRHALSVALRLALGGVWLTLAALFAPPGPPGSGAGDAHAADLATGLFVAPPQVILPEVVNLCTIYAPAGYVEVYVEPRGEFWGKLPAGMIVEVIDWPYSDVTDLWVRIKPPREDVYYGWVATATFSCA